MTSSDGGTGLESQLPRRMRQAQWWTALQRVQGQPEKLRETVSQIENIKEGWIYSSVRGAAYLVFSGP